MNDDAIRVMDTLPATTNSRVDWDAVAAMARQNPGRWVEAPVPLNPSVATQIKAGKYPRVSPQEFDVTTRKSEVVGKSHIYIKTK